MAVTVVTDYSHPKNVNAAVMFLCSPIGTQCLSAHTFFFRINVSSSRSGNITFSTRMSCAT